MFHHLKIFILIIVSTLTNVNAAITKSEDILYHCKLQWIYENHLEQFRFNEPRTLTCIYRCQGFSSQFKWLEKQNPKGCKFNKTLHKT